MFINIIQKTFKTVFCYLIGKVLLCGAVESSRRSKFVAALREGVIAGQGTVDPVQQTVESKESLRVEPSRHLFMFIFRLRESHWETSISWGLEFTHFLLSLCLIPFKNVLRLYSVVRFLSNRTSIK